MINIAIGLIFIVGGFTGRLALRGTSSGIALGVIGIGLVVWGVVQIVRAKKNQDAQAEE